MRLFYLFLIIISSFQLFSQTFISDSVSVEKKISQSNEIEVIQLGANIHFEKSSHGIKQVLQGSKLNYSFYFKNTGTEPLFISNVRTNCHCTVASYPLTPILIGESGEIELELDTEMIGTFSKRVGVYSNASNEYFEDIGQSRIVLNIIWTVISADSIKQ